MPPSQLSELGLDEVPGHVHALLEVDGAPLEGVVMVQLQPRPLAQLDHEPGALQVEALQVEVLKQVVQ